MSGRMIGIVSVLLLCILCMSAFAPPAEARCGRGILGLGLVGRFRDNRVARVEARGGFLLFPGRHTSGCSGNSCNP